MRKDEEGNECPSTLGEYYDYCVALSGKKSTAAEFLMKKILEQGRDEKVLAPDNQMRMLLFPMIFADIKNDPSVLNICEIEKLSLKYGL